MKPDNVIVKADNSAKLIDFGISMPVCAVSGRVGTLIYMNPTFFVTKGIMYMPTVDIYSYGVSAYAVAFNRLSFFNLLNLQDNILNDGTFLLPKAMSKSLALIIDGTMKFKPEDRLTVEEIEVLIQKGLTDDKDSKLEHNYFASIRSKLDLNQPAGFFKLHATSISASFYYVLAIVACATVVAGLFKNKGTVEDHTLPIFSA